MAGQQIPVNSADDMKAEYINFMTNLGVNMNEQTQSVSFTGSTVMDYLNETMRVADELRVFMGFDPQTGRSSVILWPYQNGQPATSGDGGEGEMIEPFDAGTGNP
ncbi:MAG TPA: hypothetical protein VIZ28_14800 [Chitinophagaceae bacterium]